MVTKDNQSCGHIIGEGKENIVVEDGEISQHFYQVPKSTVDGYNGAQIIIKVKYKILNYYNMYDFMTK
ncbi:MAG: hypothetical protein AB7F53_08340 [Nitrososphaeraceae archaeon]